MHNAIRIFVGCDPNDCDLEQMMVLEYSARKHASRPVEITWMRLSRDPASPWYCAVSYTHLTLPTICSV